MHKSAAALGATGALREFHGAFAQSKQGVVFAASNILAGMEVGATLANDNVAGDNVLTTVTLHTKSLGMRIATIAGGAKTFFMSHEYLPTF